MPPLRRNVDAKGEGESMTITYHPELVQGEEAWHAARCGLLTASEMKLIITPTLKAASNDKERVHLYELLAQRITKHVEPRYVSDDMLRGQEDEIYALEAYGKAYSPFERVGFVTNDKWGFTIGYSPDGLIGDNGQVECKSRSQKYQVQTICDYVPSELAHPDFAIQVQTGLLVTERDWCDLVSYSGGLPMATVRVFPDEKVQTAIVDAAAAFESRIADKLATYNAILASKARLIPTVRRVHEEMFGGMRETKNDDSKFFTNEELKGGIPL